MKYQKKINCVILQNVCHNRVVFNCETNFLFIQAVNPALSLLPLHRHLQPWVHVVVSTPPLLHLHLSLIAVCSLVSIMSLLFYE